mmetsp:Transcript_4257/g.6237  ORF Transcript_4257/g.6237 Transcript_4257/m.6237 type:complete len:400 (-) Transcript_4257:151-1350(-)|eukprot:CAMPEP_0194081160 /NCGR_PEP_ID=MMETSP0149-20130528/7027_1 /TAXON_ID=122233 /ORGANISM="Chaetoceros debilis, Strain MM31A-1" /LENGTH=399 /DNA_ID=CAMNT_0038763033 /DNA_START=49 /DNA_END=1248 /DNA_ORIENTATION=+
MRSERDYDDYNYDPHDDRAGCGGFYQEWSPHSAAGARMDEPSRYPYTPPSYFEQPTPLHHHQQELPRPLASDTGSPGRRGGGGRYYQNDTHQNIPAMAKAPRRPPISEQEQVKVRKRTAGEVAMYQKKEKSPKMKKVTVKPPATHRKGSSSPTRRKGRQDQPYDRDLGRRRGDSQIPQQEYDESRNASPPPQRANGGFIGTSRIRHIRKGQDYRDEDRDFHEIRYDYDGHERQRRGERTSGNATQRSPARRGGKREEDEYSNYDNHRGRDEGYSSRYRKNEDYDQDDGVYSSEDDERGGPLDDQYNQPRKGNQFAAKEMGHFEDKPWFEHVSGKFDESCPGISCTGKSFDDDSDSEMYHRKRDGGRNRCKKKSDRGVFDEVNIPMVLCCCGSIFALTLV